MKQLIAENVEAIFLDCLFKDGEDTANAKIVEGVMSKFGFNSDRLKSHSEEIKQMLNCLPEQFHAAQGGWSFLNACATNTGELWGEHRNVEQLLVLGLATGQVKLCIEREFWKMLPGGMPYFVVL